MRARLLFIISILFALSFHSVRIAAQTLPDLTRYKTEKQKLDALVFLSDTLIRNEDFARLEKVSRYALSVTPKDRNYYLSLFNFNLGVATELTKSDSSFIFHERGLAYAKKSKNGKRIIESVVRLLYNYTNEAGYKKQSEAMFKEILAIRDTIHDDMERAGVASTISTYYSMKGAYEKQAKYLLEAIRIKKGMIESGKIKDREAVAVDLLSLGEMYIGINQAEKGMMYARESRNYMTVTLHYRNHYYKDMADGYLALRQPQKAKVYYDSLTAMLAEKSHGGRAGNVIASDLAFTDYYLSVNKIDTAWQFVSDANRLLPLIGDSYFKSQVDYMTGNVLLAKKEYAKALPLLKASEPLSRDSGIEVYVGLLQALAKCYAATGQWKNAYEYYDKYAPLRDSLYLESSKKSLADAEAQYQNQDKQHQIEVKNLQIDEAQKQRLWLISGLALLSLSVVLLAVIYRNKRKNAQVLDEKNHQLSEVIKDLEEANSTKAKLFSIISHDLRSPISQVYQFLKLQQLNPNLLNESQKAELSQRIQSATGSLLETMEDLLLWSKTQMNQFKTDIQPVEIAHITDQCLKLLDLNIEAKNIKIEKHIDQQIEIETDPYYLQAIIRNLLQNAVKAAPESGTMQLRWDNLDKTLSIENTGRAFTQAEYKHVLSQTNGQQGLNGLGLRLVDELATKTGLEVRFETPDNTSTRAIVKF